MNPEEVKALEDGVNAELTQALSRQTLIDEQLKELRNQRRALADTVQRARGMLRAIELTRTKPVTLNPSPALERQRADQAATETALPPSNP